MYCKEILCKYISVTVVYVLCGMAESKLRELVAKLVCLCAYCVGVLGDKWQ